MQATVAPDISEVCADTITEPIRDNTVRAAYFHSAVPMNYLLNCLCKWRSLILSQRYWLPTTRNQICQSQSKNMAGDWGSRGEVKGRPMQLRGADVLIQEDAPSVSADATAWQQLSERRR